jgi:hypothetical protein
MLSTYKARKQFRHLMLQFDSNKVFEEEEAAAEFYHWALCLGFSSYILVDVSTSKVSMWPNSPVTKSNQMCTILKKLCVEVLFVGFTLRWIRIPYN